MEEKNLTEQESLELITRMINQTKKESAVGSGNTFLVWGYLCAFMSLAVCGLLLLTRDGRWSWLYIAIPVLGFIATGIVARRVNKKFKGPKTYQEQSIDAIWGCLAAVFGIYMIFCFANWSHPECWEGMFLLGLLLPGLGTACTGFILKENLVSLCGGIGSASGLVFLVNLCRGGHITMVWPIIMAVAMVFALIIPGYILNYKAKKANV